MPTKECKNNINDPVIQKISDLVQGLRYGSIEITVHNSKIVQIDKTEKTRFHEAYFTEQGGGI